MNIISQVAVVGGRLASVAFTKTPSWVALLAAPMIQTHGFKAHEGASRHWTAKAQRWTNHLQIVSASVMVGKKWGTTPVTAALFASALIAPLAVDTLSKMTQKNSITHRVASGARKAMNLTATVALIYFAGSYIKNTPSYLMKFLGIFPLAMQGMSLSCASESPK